jgi:hypothetical protein
VTSTDWTPAPAFSGRQVGQVLAGRYRLAMYKGGDDIAEVWHAVEESTQRVVTVEILRDRDDESRRARFLEQAHRMAGIERPSVMKVAAIHNEPSDTFVVFEHLIPLPVELPDAPLSSTSVVPPEAVTAPPPEAVAPPLPEWIATPLPEPSLSLPVAGPQPQPIAAVLPEWIAATPSTDAAEPTRIIKPETVRKPVLVDAEPLTVDAEPLTVDAEPVTVDAEPVIVDMDDPSAPVVLTPHARPGARQEVTRSIGLAKGDVSATMAGAARLIASVRLLLRGLQLNDRFAAVRAHVPVDGAQVRAGAAQLSVRARPMLAKTGPLIATARPLLVRARHNQVVMAVATAAILLAVFIASPLDDAIASALRPKPTAAPPATTSPTAPLARAPFAVPPLSAYAAKFESQAPFPTAVPNGAVEWVVALRNTGTVGWYRGYAGAQVALALADGTGVAVQSTDFVAPGQVGWFVVRLRARAETGTYTVSLLPRVDGSGALPDLGIHVVITVTKP